MSMDRMRVGFRRLATLFDSGDERWSAALQYRAGMLYGYLSNVELLRSVWNREGQICLSGLRLSPLERCHLAGDHRPLALDQVTPVQVSPGRGPEAPHLIDGHGRASSLVGPIPAG